MTKPFQLSLLDRENCPKGSLPLVWSEFVRVADEARASGVTKWGARPIIEIIRYENVIKRGNRQFKVNNNEQAGLSRAYMDMRQCWGFFEIRGDAVLDRAA